MGGLSAGPSCACPQKFARSEALGSLPCNVSSIEALSHRGLMSSSCSVDAHPSLALNQRCEIAFMAFFVLVLVVRDLFCILCLLPSYTELGDWWLQSSFTLIILFPTPGNPPILHLTFCSDSPLRSKSSCLCCLPFFAFSSCLAFSSRRLYISDSGMADSVR